MFVIGASVVAKGRGCNVFEQLLGILLRFTRISNLILAGRTEAEMNDAMATAIHKKDLPPMESGAMCYMMSKPILPGASNTELGSEVL